MKPGELLDALLLDASENVGPVPIYVSVVCSYNGKVAFELRSPVKGGKAKFYARQFSHSDLRASHMTPGQMSLELINAAYAQWLPDLFERSGKIRRA